MAFSFASAVGNGLGTLHDRLAAKALSRTKPKSLGDEVNG